MSKDPITPVRATRPGAWASLDIFERQQYMEGLQNRNATALLEVLGSAPPLVEEIIVEDKGLEETKKMVYKSLKTAGRWAGRMTGLTSMTQGISATNQSLKNQFINRIIYENESKFAYISGLFREIKGAYENYVSQYQTSAAVGSFLGGGLGYAIGYTWLGPIGASVFGWIGESVGALTFGFLEQIGFSTTYGGREDQFIKGPTMWIPTEEYEPYAPLPGGGMPETFHAPSPQKQQRIVQRRARRQLISKMESLERRLY